MFRFLFEIYLLFNNSNDVGLFDGDTCNNCLIRQCKSEEYWLEIGAY